MQPRDVKTVADARRIVEERDIDYVKIGLHDVDGQSKLSNIMTSLFRGVPKIQKRSSVDRAVAAIRFTTPENQ